MRLAPRPPPHDYLVPGATGRSRHRLSQRSGLYDSLPDARSAARSWRGDYSVITTPLVAEQKLTPNDVFGFSVAVSSPTIVVGAELDAIGDNTAQG